MSQALCLNKVDFALSISDNCVRESAQWLVGCQFISRLIDYFGLDARKPIFRGLQTTNTQTSLGIWFESHFVVNREDMLSYDETHFIQA